MLTEKQTARRVGRPSIGLLLLAGLIVVPLAEIAVLIEVAAWRDREDPISRLESRLGLAREERERVWAEAVDEVAAAERFAEESPDPDPSVIPR